MRQLVTCLALLSCVTVAHAGPWDDNPFSDNTPSSTSSSSSANTSSDSNATSTASSDAAKANNQKLALSNASTLDTGALPTSNTSLPSLKIVPSDDLWQRIRNGFGMAEMDDPLVQENEEWYANRPDYTKRMLERSKRYLHFVVEEVEKRGMPMEIALLPMIESAYNPNAYSRSQASGIWQFIPSTGKHFGLEQSWWYDGRRDIVAATRAALDYLERLYGMFGSWDLALAAYNWGEGAVARAQAKNAARGEPTDYQSLNLPNETRNYVPRLLAVKHLIANPDSFGVNLPPVANTPYLAHIKTDKQMDVRVAAKLADMPVEEFLSLNPAYNRPVMARNGKCNLLLPVDKVDSFENNLAQYDKPLLSWQAYHAHRGEKPEQIAHKFGITVAELKQRNEIKVNRRNRLVSDLTLLVPLRSGSGVTAETVAMNDSSETATPSRSRKEQDTPRRSIYVVKAGDTLFSIARKYDIAVADIQSCNRLRGNHVTRGQKLVLENSGSPAKAEPARKLASNDSTERKADKKTATRNKHSSKRMYTVRRGDTLYSIARHFDVSVTELARLNNLRGQGSLKPGQKVVVSEA